MSDERCRECVHWVKGRCQRQIYNTAMVRGKREWIGRRTQWNHKCIIGEFKEKESEEEE